MVSSGAISIGGNVVVAGSNQSAELELYQAQGLYNSTGTATGSLNDTAIRTLAGIASGPISLGSLYGTHAHRVISYTTAGTYSYTVPAGVTSIDLLAAGGGGSGGGAYFSFTAGGAGGGGGGGQVQNLTSVSVTPGQVLTIVVGAGGQSTAGNAGNVGGNTTIMGTGVSVTARGGAGGGLGGGAISAAGAVSYQYNDGTSTYSGGTGGGSSAGGGGGTGLTSFTANGVLYASSSSALTTGSALTFDGTNLGLVGTGNRGLSITTNTSGNPSISFIAAGVNSGFIQYSRADTALELSADGSTTFYSIDYTGVHKWLGPSNAEQMRLNSTGLGIGTSSPVGRLTIQGAAGTNGINQGIGLLYSNGTQYGAFGLNNSSGWPQLMARAGAGITFHVNSDLLTTGEAMRLDTSGNLGLGVTPSAWGIGTNGHVLEFSNAGSMWNYSNTSGINLSQNLYYNGAYYYKSTAAATVYAQGSGQHIWYNAPSGTAGTAFTPTQAMTLDVSGNLSVLGTVGVNTSSILASATFTSSTTTANQIIYSVPTATYRSAKLMVQMTSGTSYQVTELLIIHDGTNAFMTQYGDIATTGTSLGTFDSSITSGNLNLLFTPTNAATTVKLSSSLIVL